MNRKVRTVVALGLFCCLVLGSVVLAAPEATTIDWWVIASGGGHAETGAYTLDGTIGQPVVGRDQNAGYGLCAGFWGCGAGHRVYLPLVVRDP
jgi:hypothetical protein